VSKHPENAKDIEDIKHPIDANNNRMDAENAEINELIRKVVHDLLGLKAYTLLFQTAFI